MTQITIRFCTDNSPISRLIRWRTQSNWSHVSLLIHSEFQWANYQNWLTSLPFKGVCQYSNGFEFAREYRLDLSNHQLEQMRQFITKTLGCPYDWFGAIGLGIDRDWQHPDQWFCSEWVAAALLAAGAIHTPNTHRVTPGQLEKIVLSAINVPSIH